MEWENGTYAVAMSIRTGSVDFTSREDCRLAVLCFTSVDSLGAPLYCDFVVDTVAPFRKRYRVKDLSYVSF